MFAILELRDKPTIFAVIAGYLLTLLVVGIVFRRFNRDTIDYFREGGKATWWQMGGRVFKQAFSAWAFTGAAGAAFQVGWSLPTMFVSNVLGFILIGIFTGGRFRQLRCITAPDLVRLRLGGGMEQFVAFLSLLTGPIYGGVQLYGLAIFTSILLGTNIFYTIVLLGFVVLFYAGISGAWAVMAADFVKALVLVPITVMLAVICLRELGGISGMLEAIRHAGLAEAYAPVKSPKTLATISGINPGWFTWTFLLAWHANNILVANSFTNGGRYLAAKDGREARRAAFLAAGLFFLGLLTWFIPPITARLLMANEVMAMPLPKPAEGAYAAAAIHFLPAGLVGLVLVAMCAATMSSLDVGLNSLAGGITQNIYPAACRLLKVTPWEGRTRLIFARFVSLFCAMTVITCALLMAKLGHGGIFSILVSALATLAPPVAVPLVLSFFFRRVSPIVAVSSVAIGLVVSISIYFAPIITTVEPWVFQKQVGTVIAVAALVFFVARAIFPPDAETLAREEEFFSRRDRKVEFAVEIGVGNDGRQLRIVGAFGVALGLATLLLLIPASSKGHLGEICIVALFTFTVGGTMAWKGRRQGEKVELPIG